MNEKFKKGGGGFKKVITQKGMDFEFDQSKGSDSQQIPNYKKLEKI